MSKVSEKLDERISRTYTELNLLNSIAETLQKQHENLTRMLADAQLTLDTLRTIKEASKGSNVLIPLGSLIMINALIEDNETAFLRIGSGVIVKESIPKIEDYIENYILQLQREQLAVQKKLEEILNRISILQAELNKLIQTYQSKG